MNSLPPGGLQPSDLTAEDVEVTAAVIAINANDPTGASGLSADLLSMSSVGVLALPVCSGWWVRDTSAVHEFRALSAEAVEEQVRTLLEDMPVAAMKLGFAGSTEALSTISEIASDYPNLVLLAYMPDLSWWDASHIDDYLDAFRELVLPQSSVLIGNAASLQRWLLPDWPEDKPCGPRDIAAAAGAYGTPYVLVTGLQDGREHVGNALVSAHSVLLQSRFERIEVSFDGAGDTLSAALTALIALGNELPAATEEALQYLDQSLSAGFSPGMGRSMPDRLFWAEGDEGEADAEGEADTTSSTAPSTSAPDAAS